MEMKDDRARCAGILTQEAPHCRNSGARRVPVGMLVLLLLSFGPSAALIEVAEAAGAESDRAWQPIADITRAAETFLRPRIAATDRQIAAEAGKLDPRLRLPRCDIPLHAWLRPGSDIDRRTVVGVRCNGSRPWKVYVPVKVVEMRTVLVARQSLPRDHVLQAEDLVAEERDVSRLIDGYFSDPGAALGRRLEQRLVAGSVLAPSMLEEEIVIRRGQSVTLVVRNDTLNIRMGGTALMDGTLNQRIRVENTASERIVEGVVRSPQYVEVLVR